jgi:hypothetical protein
VSIVVSFAGPSTRRAGGAGRFKNGAADGREWGLSDPEGNIHF